MEICLRKSKAEQGICTVERKIFDVINSFTLSSNALKALIAQSLNQKILALNIWTENVKLCAYLGDEHLWTLSQKQCLKIAQEITPENNDIIINNIHEKTGQAPLRVTAVRGNSVFIFCNKQCAQGKQQAKDY